MFMNMLISPEMSETVGILVRYSNLLYTKLYLMDMKINSKKPSIKSVLYLMVND